MTVQPAPDLSIVIPVYNEGKNIVATVRELEAAITVAHEVFVVYDRDDDTTVPELQPLLPDYPHWTLVKNQVARGPSGALRTGFAHARAPLVLVIMADLCDDFSQIPELMALVPSKADIACPSRYCPGGQQQLAPSLKVWLPRWAGTVIRMLTGMGTCDPTNSFKLYSGEMLRDLHLVSTISFSVTLEIVAKAHCLGYRITEVPTVWRDRQHGKTNFKLGRSVVAYFPWLCLAALRGRIVRIPRSWLTPWISAAPNQQPVSADC